MSPAATLWQAIGTWLAHTTRTTLLYESAMYILPAESTATLVGFASCALVASPPSPLKPAPKLFSPATVEIMLLVLTSRITKLPASALYRLPSLSNVIPVGLESSVPVAVANDPSPAYPAMPLPTTVLIMPVLGLSWRIRLLMVSEVSTLPEESRITSDGPKRNAFVAGPPSPA